MILAIWWTEENLAANKPDISPGSWWKPTQSPNGEYTGLSFIK